MGDRNWDEGKGLKGDASGERVHSRVLGRVGATGSRLWLSTVQFLDTEALRAVPKSTFTSACQQTLPMFGQRRANDFATKSHCPQSNAASKSLCSKVLDNTHSSRARQRSRCIEGDGPRTGNNADIKFLSLTFVVEVNVFAITSIRQPHRARTPASTNGQRWIKHDLRTDYIANASLLPHCIYRSNTRSDTDTPLLSNPHSTPQLLRSRHDVTRFR